MSKIIFVVEDDASIRNDICELLIGEGYQVRSFANGQLALDALNAALKSMAQESLPLPHLIILDLMMPVMNGYELLDEIYKVPQFEPIHVLVFSADGQSDQRLPRDRVKAFMKKPIDLEPFIELVDKLIG